ncbi:MAG: hypothetical protein HF976_00815 [ANME-2 cluster archaeon]|nr:hypothetical protein [ANME-2 cluster archaeon]MBC2699954.1 hypothetical protein [ANME-2 cluster archaeon]MBC2707067.1 hypothetical protein [ANME-2 cluster archaeon]MBC2746919.1 hypothetical protein [ANME-2 cluster archaeon]MBC2762016.1 hypothetical protein [ANME-2 cluster archaeon]
MLTTKELSGIVETMVVVSEEEIIDIAQELAYLRDDETPDLEYLRQLITLAMKIHWLEPIPSTAVFNCPQSSMLYIAGPASFGTVPPELSEIMDTIEFKGCRSFDWGMVTSNVIPDISRRLDRLEALVEDAADGIEKVETEYSELFNLYYDYDFWLPDGLPGIGGRLEDISQRLKEIKEAD